MAMAPAVSRVLSGPLAILPMDTFMFGKKSVKVILKLEQLESALEEEETAPTGI